ncbi:MAG: hypothetical protein K9H84_01735 [Bacteroidales bacterium]|nr:hypothetical protein [Bacteroidales bacterium]
MRKTVFIVFLILLAGHNNLFAQYDGSSSGGRSAAMGDAAVTSADVWSILNNPAGLAENQKMSAGIFYEMRYNIADFSTRGAAFQLPAGRGNFGIAFSVFGISAYNEKHFAVAYGRELFPEFKGGISFDYLHTHLNDESGQLTANKGILTFQAGIQYKLTDKTGIGFSVFNPYSARLSDYENEYIPAIARLGLDYKAADHFLIVLEAEQNIKYNLRIKGGLEYEIKDRLMARGGVKTNPAEYTFGGGIKFMGITFDFAFAYHLVLGYSPYGSFQYQF